jgi:hypothetical protein
MMQVFLCVLCIKCVSEIINFLAHGDLKYQHNTIWQIELSLHKLRKRCKLVSR